MAVASTPSLSWSSSGSWPCLHSGSQSSHLFENTTAVPMILAQKKAKKTRKVKEMAEQLALIFQMVGAFKVKHKGGKGKQIFGSVSARDLVDIIKAQLQRDVDK